MTPETGIVTLEWSHSRYPAWLRMVPDPPPVLWVRGDLSVLEQTSVAIVGSRSASQYAREVSRSLAAGLAGAGIVVTSGMARGVDGAAHEACLAAGGRTIAVLGSGVDVIYPPEHEALSERIAAAGLLVSELPPGSLPYKAHFPRRNRIISGLSRAVVIVEASEKSGSLITAKMALEQGREVMAVPGSVLHGRNRGAHALIKDGATPVEDAADILDALGLAGSAGLPPSRAASADRRSLGGGGQARDAKRRAGTGSAAGPVEAALEKAGLTGIDVDVLAREIGREPESLLGELTELELDGKAERLSGGRYVWKDDC